MPKREDEFWAAQKEPKRTGCCPRCGNTNISYNEKFQSWRCNSCEHSFPVPSFGATSEPRPKIPWNDKWFDVNSEGEKAEDVKEPETPLPEIEEDFEETEQDYNRIKADDKSTSKSKAWFGNEYFDKKTRKWKKPGYRTSSVVISIIILVAIIVIVVIFLWYVFIFAKPVS
jgi:transcription elongation factor Elf1